MSAAATSMRNSRSNMRSRMLVLVVVLAACGKGDKPPPPSQAVGLAQETGPSHRPQPGGETADMAEAKNTFLTICAACHGPDGKGTGPAAEALNPKPRNYTDPAWQASVTDDEIRKIIVLGGAGVGKSAMMPPNPKLKDQPAVVDALVQIIRSFGKPR